MQPAQRNRTEVLATSLDDAGHGVGQAGPHDAARHTIHVADLLPGERAEVQIDHTSPHKAEAWGHIVRRLGTTSPDRTSPACPAFGRCGGCVWQHLAYPAQLAEKHRRVAAALEGIAIPIPPVRPAPSPLGYRNKGKYVAGRSGDHVVLGAYAPRSHHVIDTLGCRVVAPVIDEVATWVRGAAEAAGLLPYDEKARTGDLRYVIIREADSDTMVALVVAPHTPRTKLEQVANALSRHPAIRSVVAIENDRRDGAIVPSGSGAQVLFGKGALVEDIAGVKVEVGAGEFLQVNRAQATALYARVAELAVSSAARATAVDLFAGVGGIGIHLARAGMRVVSVELDREAVGQLRRAAERANLALVAVAGDAGAITAAEIRAHAGSWSPTAPNAGALGGSKSPTAPDAGAPGVLVNPPRNSRVRVGVADAAAPDVVVVNPPRKGLSDDARALLVELAPPIIIYVSCGPEALGRDLLDLARHGYEPDVIEPFDLMPGTPQVETVIRLRRVVVAEDDAG